jgi:hypothetical protein
MSASSYMFTVFLACVLILAVAHIVLVLKLSSYQPQLYVELGSPSILPSRWGMLHYRVKLDDPRTHNHGIKAVVLLMRFISLVLVPASLAGFVVFMGRN